MGVDHNVTMSGAVLFVLVLQGLYYGLTGLWPIVHIDSFLKVTGPKTDLWLVKTVGLLIVVIGATLGLSAYRRQWSAEIAVLAIGSAVVLAVVDGVYALKRRIMKVYLLDAAGEVGLLALWGVALAWK